MMSITGLGLNFNLGGHVLDFPLILNQSTVNELLTKYMISEDIIVGSIIYNCCETKAPNRK